MPQFYILIFAALVVSFFFLRFLWRNSFIRSEKPSVKGLSKKRLDVATDSLKTSEPDFWDDYKNKVITKYTYVPFLGISKRQKKNLQVLIDSVEDENTSTTPETIHFNQVMLTTAFVVGCVVVSLIFKYALLGILLSGLIYKAPLTTLKERYKKNIQEITFQFPDFYDAVYCQYSKHEANVLLTDIVHSFMPIANPSFKKLLKRFLIDLESGEEYALRELDARYDGFPILHKFCSIMRLRLKGDEAAFLSMTSLRDTLQADVRDWMMEDLNKRKKIATKWTVTMVTVIMTMVMLVYFGTLLTMAT